MATVLQQLLHRTRPFDLLQHGILETYPTQWELTFDMLPTMVLIPYISCIPLSDSVLASSMPPLVL